MGLQMGNKFRGKKTVFKSEIIESGKDGVLK